MPAYDVIVIGAGHNGLATAAFLAKAGRHVLVLERRDTVGGLAASEEFHPGTKSAGVFADTTLLQRPLLEELQLERHGLVWRDTPPDTLALGTPGDALLLHGEPGKTAAAIGARKQRDAAQYLAYAAQLDAWRATVQGWMHEIPLDPTEPGSFRLWELLRRGLRLRRLGRRELRELLRVPPLCIADWLGEWFEDDLLKTALALPGLASTFMGPRSPGGGALQLRHVCAAGNGVAGGGPQLVAALERAARENGAEIRTRAVVAAIRTGSAVEGVTLADGQGLDAPIVAASCPPQTVFLSLLSPRQLPSRLAHRFATYRSRGTTAQVLLALRSPLRFAAHPEIEIEFARTGACLDDIERAFDAVKYGHIAPRPELEIHVPTVADPGLAPTGHSVASILVHFAPYALEPGWDAGERERLGDRVVEILGEHVQQLDVVGRRVLAPPDLEAAYALPGGNVHHGEHALDQLLLRPARQCVGYRTPIAGLYLCGSGSHPGGGLTGAPGALAARAILRS